ncbi:MAG: shikimate dehydrogenase [Lachnospiraceae bacterium]|nr:shikimate dehydrogenase [Lachnospiraceae bacterium]
MDVNTKLYGLMGHPVGHSVSPALQNELIRLYGLNAVYLAWDVETAGLEEAVKGGKSLGIGGFNVTVPHKKNVIPYLKDIDEAARKLGSVNTLKYTPEGYVGYNTDLPGLMRAFEYDGVSFEGRNAVLIGAGGAANAALGAILESGANRVLIINRTMERAEELKQRFEAYYPAVRMDCVSSQTAAVKLMREETDKWNVLQATSVGMYPDTEAAAVTEEAFYEMVDCGVDIIYNPEKTLFMKKVEAAGGTAYNGLKMLLFQGVRSFEIWNELKVDDKYTEQLLDIMRGAMKR